LIALNNTDIKLNFKINKLNDLVRKNSNLIANQESDLKISLLADYIYLDTKERELFGKLRHDYLIEQTQFNEIKNFYDKNIRIKLDFKNCIKDIYYFIRCEDDLINKDRGNYSLNDSENSGNPITFTRLIANNINIFTQTGDYTNYITPYQSYISTPSDGVNIINFGLGTNSIQPKGSLNFSMFDKLYLDVDINESYLKNKNKKIYIFANSYNMLRIMGGQAGLSHIK
jgi:hypothetical protein